jgi:hypothetical protein
MGADVSIETSAYARAKTELRALRSGGSRSASLLFPPATHRDRNVTGSPLDRESTEPASVRFPF